MRINDKKVGNVKVGDKAIFHHRVSPCLPIIEELGEILSTGVTPDGRYYVQASVGSHTKKYVFNN